VTPADGEFQIADRAGNELITTYETTAGVGVTR
jgi:hypothetical protein